MRRAFYFENMISSIWSCENKAMRIIGIDITSRPSRRKPLTAAHGDLEESKLSLREIALFHDFEALETCLTEPGPFIMGLDCPLSLPHRFLETIGLPLDWEGVTTIIGAMEREEFREVLNRYKQDRASGDKEHFRACDRLAGGVSPQKLYGVPVALMHYEIAPRLMKSRLNLPHLGVWYGHQAPRIAFESYPAPLARFLIGRNAYKSEDSRKKNAPELKNRRQEIVNGLKGKAFRNRYRLTAVIPDDLQQQAVEDTSGDCLDAILCAVQAAWAWQNRDNHYGAPPDYQSKEGWIADPALLY